MMQDVADPEVRGCLRRMRLGDDHDAGIAAILVDRHDLTGRAEGNRRAKRRDGRIDGDRCHRMPHHPADREISDPADVGGAANGLAPQVETPGGERVAECLARHLGRDDHGHQHRGRQPEVAGGLQRDEDHGERSADDRHRQRAHRDDRIGVAVEGVRRPQPSDGRGKQLPAQRAKQQGGKEQPAAKAAAQRDDRGDRLQHEDQRDLADRPVDDAGEQQGPMPRRHDLG